MELDLEDLADRETREFDGFNDRLLALLPALHDHGCARGTPGAFVDRLRTGTYFGHVIEHVALELSEPAGAPVNYGKTVSAGTRGVYRLVVESTCPPLMRFLLETAVELVGTLLTGQDYTSLPERLSTARRIVDETTLGPSTRAIVEAAARRGIPVCRLNDASLVQLGHGRARRLIEATVASTTSAVAVEIASDKQVTREILKGAYLPTPAGAVARSDAAAIEILSDIDGPVAVKPLKGNQGKGISLGVRTEEDMRRAFAAAAAFDRAVVVEEMFEGDDYRVLVVGGRFVAACRRIPAEVCGDGRQTVQQLVDEANRDPRRGLDHEKPLTAIKVDDHARALLAEQGLNEHAVPAAGTRVRLRAAANLSTGGTARDVTDIVHPDVRAMCERAARVIGLDICGVDLVLRDISRPLGLAEGIVEVNAGPGLRMHHHPSDGEARDAGAAIVDMLFPDGSSGRIPIASVTGTNGKTTTARMIARALACDGKMVGLTTTDGLYVGGRRVADGDLTGPRSAHAVLADPAVEAAVLETARGGIVRFGLGYDWSDVGVLTNIQADHIGQDGIESLDDLVHIKSLVAERVREGGTLVLNADDERVAALTEADRVRQLRREIVFFSLHPRRPRVLQHLASGGSAWFPKNGWIVRGRGATLEPICRIAAMPWTMGGAAQFNLANALAAAAAARAMGASSTAIAEALATFVPERENQGRANLFAVNGGHLLLDYGHNPAAIRAIGLMTSRWNVRRVTGVVGLPGDRADEVIVEAADAAASSFDRVIVREDDNRRGRRPGEMADLIVAAVRRRNPGCACSVVLDEREALRHALDSMEPAELVVMFYDHLEPLLDVLRDHHATAVEGGLGATQPRGHYPSAPLVGVAADRGRNATRRERPDRPRRRPA